LGGITPIKARGFFTKNFEITAKIDYICMFLWEYYKAQIVSLCERYIKVLCINDYRSVY
jgi:hypothetical protein